MVLEPGLVGSLEHTVKDGDTAEALRSGDVPMLATPRLIALSEEATLRALDGELDAKATTVGMRVQLDHLIPVPVGGTVHVEAKLEKCEGRRLIFTVSITNEHGLVGAGKVTRVIVNRERFLERAR